MLQTRLLPAKAAMGMRTFSAADLTAFWA